MRLGLVALILCTCCVWFGQGDDDVGPPYIYGNRKVIWNPRFLNPETDPDFNDFDKSGWNVAAGGSGEYIHHKIAALVVFADTGKVDMNFEGMIFVEGRSNDFIETGNTTFEYDYPGKMCIQQSAQLIGVDILTPSIPTLPNCVGNCWEYRSPFTAVRYGHIFISDMYFSLPFNNDPGMVRSILIAPRLFWDYDGIPFDNMTLKIPNVQALTADYRPDRIKLASPLPTSIEANTPFTVQLKMVNSDDNVITTSFNSGLEIMAQVAYTHKWFERIGGLWLVDTDAVLNGPDVVTSVINDRVIFTRFVGGYANITIQIEDVHPNLELNFTSKWPLRPYRRFPTNEINPYKSGGLSVDYSTFQTFGNHLTHPDSNVTHVKYQHFEGQPNYFRGSLIANITITPQVAVALRIIEGPTWKLFQFVNREFKGPLQIEAIDANGRRVTSGPDSNLTVTPSCDNNLIKFSGDAIITLYRGHAMWKGSLVTMSTTDIHLKFTTEATNGSIESNNTKSFTVIGSTFLVNNFISDTEWDVFEAIKAFLQYDKYGPLNNKILMQTFMHVKTVAELEQNFDDAETQVQIKEYKRGDYSVMFGPSDDTLLDSFISIAQANKLPLINYRITDSKYADTQRFPNLVRMKYSKEYQYTLVCNFLKSRRWDKLVLLTSIDEAAPAEFVNCARIFNINYNPVSFPSVKDGTTVLSDAVLKKFFDQLEAIHIRTIVSHVSGHALKYLVAEATLRGITHQNGYQWVGTLPMNDDFPFNNEGKCNGIISPTNHTCVESFKGTFMFKPNYATYGFNNGYWGAFKGLFNKAQEFADGATLGYTREPYPTDPERILQMGLIFDGAYLVLMAYAGILDNKETFQSKDLLQKMIKIEHPMPLTGDSVLFDSQYGRTNYSALLHQIDGWPGATGKSVLVAKRYLYLGDNVTPYNVTLTNQLKEVGVTGQQIVFVPTAPVSEFNMIPIKGTKATMNLVHQTSENIMMSDKNEKFPPAFYCTGGCGGAMLSYEHRHSWENGECIAHETCSCKLDNVTGNPQFSGSNCQTPVCVGCVYGDCVAPNDCVCHSGYVDSNNATNDCGLATCFKYGCHAEHGSCTGGDFCMCEPGYYGKDCSMMCDCGPNGICSDGNSGSGLCTCESDYTGESCKTHKAVIAVPAALGLAFAIAILLYIGHLYYKRIELNAQLMSTDWVAEWDTIRMRQKKKQSSMKSLISMVTTMSAKSETQKEEKVVCQNQGSWNGKDIVVKLIRKEDVELNDKLRWEVKEMRDIKHANLCLFIGACIDTEHVAILNEVCGKGSLEDILSNDDIDLGWDFRYSMMKDITRGMMYLQNTDIGSHGRLKTSNCLVDNRWTIKISDYGLKSFKAGQEGVRVFAPENGIGVDLPNYDELEECDYYNLLWTAPEILKSGVSHPDHVGYGTKKGDIYSFAIILVEMCTRNHPFHEIDHLGPAEIVQIVGRLADPGKTLRLTSCRDNEKIPIECLRPEVLEDELPQEEKQAFLLMQLIEQCWNEDPLCRPEFKTCMSDLGKISPHRGELMDNLIELMEQYTTSLESIVSERTADIMVEKEKGDLLLGKMLPPLIAEELKLGKNPQPEFFAQVTIYFSDCVGFGKICANASPYQVVELLNDLYSVMDDIIESFDCYKVETIGDCYVVASGLPVRNGDNHAGEVASMALALMTAIDGVGYKNLPGSQVQLRMGLNTGPIVAGVVGLKMPRYCLFGDTMNTASRMESGGYALKIHMSESTYKVLDTLGGYQSECRGEREIKGKGRMTTYWLTGKEGSDYKIPDETLALSVSQHNFK